MATVDLDELGRVVRDSWVAYCRETGDTKTSHLTPYDELGEWDKEADRRIGKAIARHLGHAEPRGGTHVVCEACDGDGRQSNWCDVWECERCKGNRFVPVADAAPDPDVAALAEAANNLLGSLVLEGLKHTPMVSRLREAVERIERKGGGA